MKDKILFWIFVSAPFAYFCFCASCTKTEQAPTLPPRTIVLPPVFILKMDTVYIHDTLYIGIDKDNFNSLPIYQDKITGQWRVKTK